MPEIEWNDSFSVNNIEIDNQHKKWIEIFNKLHKSLMAGDSTAYSNIAAETLEAMQEYALKHFTLEEEYMKENNYPDIVRHRRIHKDFSTLIYSYKNSNGVSPSFLTEIPENKALSRIIFPTFGANDRYR